MEKIIEKANELSALLKECDIVKNQKAAKKAFDSNTELQEFIGAFNLAKMSLMNESNKDELNILADAMV